MYKVLLYIYLFLFSLNLISQESSKWTIDPSISVNAYIEVGVTSGIYFNLTDRFSLTSYSAVGVMVNDFAAQTNGLTGVQESNQLHLTQKAGLTWWFGNKVKNNKLKRKGISFLYGPDFRSYKGKYLSPNDTVIEDEGSNTALGYGLMYVAHNRSATSNKGWSFKVYIPLAPYQGPDNIQAFTLNFGINIGM